MNEKGWLVGNATLEDGSRGCTVLLFPGRAMASCDVRGGAPGTRDTAALDPSCSVEGIDGLFFTGGSVFGLDAAAGVVDYAREQGYGFDTGIIRVPIIPGACIFDFTHGGPQSAPDAAAARGACETAGPLERCPRGAVGAGAGATVGKYRGFEQAMPGGLGWSVLRSGALEVAALVVVNAVGAVRNEEGHWLAGARDGRGGIEPPLDAMAEGGMGITWGTSTTLAAVCTNAVLTKAEAARIAIMGHDGLAQAIFPLHTPYDGDTVFCAATGAVEAESVRVGTFATAALAAAVRSVFASLARTEEGKGCP
ncbi:MAG: P1 family peptidase [Synergistales bacterium]|nr:P1 family peptidase [Synergistales bacterium]